MEDEKQLILQAFEQARVAGKPDWHRMTTAVLKNRLLGLTGRTFNESDYGAETFTAFVERVGDLVAIDKSRIPPIVELRESEPSALELSHASSAPTRRRIRSDLWQAAMDYSGSTDFIWDTVDRRARPRQFEEDRPFIPRVTPTVRREWREGFAETVEATIAAAQKDQLASWATHQLATSKLPQPLIPQWNAFLVDRVHRHLLSWFEESGLEPPGDLMTVVVDRTTRRSSETEALRRLVMRIVGEMTDRELEQLDLPARAVLRATRTPQA